MIWAQSGCLNTWPLEEEREKISSHLAIVSQVEHYTHRLEPRLHLGTEFIFSSLS